MYCCLNEWDYQIDYLNEQNRLITVNAKYDDKDLLAPVGGVLHMKPED